jgi:hypothetical protein
MAQSVWSNVLPSLNWERVFMVFGGWGSRTLECRPAPRHRRGRRHRNPGGNDRGQRRERARIGRWAVLRFGLYCHGCHSILHFSVVPLLLAKANRWEDYGRIVPTGRPATSRRWKNSATAFRPASSGAKPLFLRCPVLQPVEKVAADVRRLSRRADSRRKMSRVTSAATRMGILRRAVRAGV